MQNILKSVPDVKVTGWWLTSCLVDIGELYFRKKWALLSTRAVHSSSSVLEKVIVRNINSTGYMLYNFLTPNLKSMDFSILPMTSLTTILSCVCLMDKNSLGGAPYFPSMEMSSAWFDI